jgi:hypothetical protein
MLLHYIHFLLITRETAGPGLTNLYLQICASSQPCKSKLAKNPAGIKNKERKIPLLILSVVGARFAAGADRGFMQRAKRTYFLRPRAATIAL